MVYNVDINANQKVIKNVKLDKSVGNSVATVAMVKELIPYTTNYFYRQYFEEFYDFADANNYGINIGSSGVIINSFKPNITIPNKDLISNFFLIFNILLFNAIDFQIHFQEST